MKLHDDKMFNFIRIKDNLRTLPRNGHSNFSYKSLKEKKEVAMKTNYSAKQETKGGEKNTKMSTT